jgi:hypothetical protein
MKFPITNRKIKKLLQEIEMECAKENPEGYALFGQLMTENNKVQLTLGSFDKEEYSVINNIIKNRKSKAADIERGKRLQIEYIK